MKQKKDNSTLGLLEDGRWYRLDNAATGFSLISTKKLTTVFRISVHLYQPVNLVRLKQAVKRVLHDFPPFRVTLRDGFFWYFWETNLKIPQIEMETSYPNGRIPFTGKRQLLFRIKAFKNRIAVEFHHTLTDGTGALFFIQALVYEYLLLSGIKSGDSGIKFRPQVIHEKNGSEDEYKKHHFDTAKHREWFPPRVFSLPFKRGRNYFVTTGIVAVQDVLTRAKESGVSLTEFFTGVYLYALKEIQNDLVKGRKAKKRPIRIMVPVNLRKIFPSYTLRNFFLYVAPSIDPRLGKYSFNEILKQVHHYMRKEVNEKILNQLMDRNIKTQWNLFLRIVPLFLKKVIVRMVHFAKEMRTYSGLLTNLGQAVMPPPFDEEIERFEFIPDPQVYKVCAAMISYKDRLFINFGRVIREPIVEKYFFRFLRKLGIRVKIEV
jgi:hypothetical protein